MKTVQCPVCQHDILVKYKGFFKKTLFLPDYCGNCGIQLYKVCPTCHEGLSSLDRYCLSCGRELYGPNKQVLTSSESSTTNASKIASIPQKQKQYLDQLQQDLEDKCLFTHEMLLVVWRLNPVGLGSYQFSELIKEIHEGMENPQIASIVGEAIGLVDFSEIETFIVEMQDIYHTIFEDTIYSNNKSFCQVYPNLKDYLSELAPADHTDLLADLDQMVLQALTSQNSNGESIVLHYQQLCEYYPRYYNIMNRTGILDIVLSFAAGLFAGPVGVAGMEAWDNWRNSSDNDFMNKFSQAVASFVEACLEFTQLTESALHPVIERFMNEYCNSEMLLLKAFERIAIEGWDLGPVYTKSREVDTKSRSEDHTTLLHIICDNIRDNPKVSQRSMNNIRNMVGI